MITRTSDIRQSFIDFFRGKDHRQYSSSPVIPFADPTLMFTNAGMNQFKDIFTGQKKAEFPRAVTVQKCMRAGGKHNDLENVGRTGRHHTFFEMLGNFSFGDYFKEEAINFAWEWVTKHLGLPKSRLYATVYKDDDEAYRLWEKIAPELKNGRILRFDEKENYWSMGETGPNGPSSELSFDRGEKYGIGPEHRVNGESDRFVEIWNLVFMQYNTRPDGTTEPLPKPSVDTGAGLERIACVMQDVPSNYETDGIKSIIEHLCDITGKKYHFDERGVSHRVIADHIRALTFCIADGGGLSNEKQGYVLRRILRRASRHGRLLDMREPFIYRLVPTLVELMGTVYPEIKNGQDHIQNVIRSEEETFGRTLDTGLELFENVAGRIKRSGRTVIPGEEVFKLYDTFGFPVDLTAVMAEERGLSLDMDGFEKLMNRQKEQSRTSMRISDEQQKFQAIIADIARQLPPESLKTEFVRDLYELETGINEMFEMDHDGQTLLAVIPQKTPFYVEAGGQISDQGTIACEQFKISADILIKQEEAIVHIGRFIEKNYNDIEEIGDPVLKLSLNDRRRLDIMRNHTATHLLHAALRNVLGEHVHQSGSYVGPDKLRFDFSHFGPMSPDEIFAVERIVNEKILKAEPVATREDDLENAKKSGAMAIFGEKYESRVRVVSVADFSQELCGGTHVENTARIGPFLIETESGIASGVRRIEALTGRAAIAKMLVDKRSIDDIGRLINRPSHELTEGIRDLQQRLLEIQKENKKLKADRFAGGTQTVGKEKNLGDLTVRFHDFGQVEPEEMAGWIDAGKDAPKPLISIAVGTINGKKTYMSSSSGQVKMIHIGHLTREILNSLGGRGGGKPNFAQGSVPRDTEAVRIFETAENMFRKSLEKK